MQFDGAIIKFPYTISVDILSALKLAARDFGMVFNILNRSSAIISRGKASILSQTLTEMLTR